MPDPHAPSDTLAGWALVAIGALALAGGILALVYLAMVGIGECADPWAGCGTVMMGEGR
jgi:hypothetical protein